MENFDSKYSPVYSLKTQAAIQEEFKRNKGKCYLDHAGATLYSERQIINIQNDLVENLYANPHSGSTCSKLTSDAIDQIRYRVLQLFHTSSEEYTVIFTSGATAGLKIIAETFNYSGGKLAYLQDNHTSVLGMRAYSDNSRMFSIEEAFKVFNNSEIDHRFKCNSSSNSLFVYPAQSNFSGYKYPLGWIEKVQNGGLRDTCNSRWFCMLDAASFVANSDLNLQEFKPDFVSISFYKIFGYPTGLGALLIRNESAAVLQKKYYGGGTVFMALSTENVVVQRSNLHERFEDGTIPFLSILSLRHGFDTFDRLDLTMEIISHHVFNLSKYVLTKLLMLHHYNNQPAAFLYHDNLFVDCKEQGGIINFNLLRANGSFIGYAEVMHIANLFGISLRTGCFCNPGACQHHLNLTSDEIKYQFKMGHVCGDENDLIEGKPTGSVRISFGYMSTRKEADDLLEMIKESFVTKPVILQIPKKLNKKRRIFVNKEIKGLKDVENLKPRSDQLDCRVNINELNTIGKICDIFLYPVKSCGACAVKSSWELVSTGLKYDRMWMIINNAGVVMTQKNESKLCLIRPLIDEEREELILNYKGFDPIATPINPIRSSSKAKSFSPCKSKICTDKINGYDCGTEVAEWLSKVLNIEGLRLIKQCSEVNGRVNQNNDDKPLSLVNKAQFLMINKSSALWLHAKIPERDFQDTIDSLIFRFRSNFVVDIPSAFSENNYKFFKIGNVMFKNDGNCNRCQMICIDQSTSEKSVEPLKTLSKEFGGKIKFGVYLRHVTFNVDHKSSNMIKVGAEILG